MFVVSYEQETGRILSVGSPGCYSTASKDCPTVIVDTIPTPASDYYVDDDILDLRPAIQEFVGSTLDLTVLPVGSIIRIENEVGDYIEATPEDLTIELVDAGAYLIKVLPPFPYKELKQTLVVT